MTPSKKAEAREAIAAFLACPHSGVGRWVRINPLDSSMTADDLACARGADGIVLPKAQSGADVAGLDAMLGRISAHPADRERDAGARSSASAATPDVRPGSPA